MKTTNNIFFTSDWHLGETRFNLFFRDFCSVPENDYTVINGFKKSRFKNGDTLYHLGDVFYEVTNQNKALMEDLKFSFPESKFILIRGNYDENKEDLLKNYFDEIHDSLELKVRDYILYLNHYPTKVREYLDYFHVNKDEDIFGITGHIHSLWKIQRDMVNVGIDAWGMRFVKEKEIDFIKTAAENYYDENVFLG